MILDGNLTKVLSSSGSVSPRVEGLVLVRMPCPGVRGQALGEGSASDPREGSGPLPRLPFPRFWEKPNSAGRRGPAGCGEESAD